MFYFSHLAEHPPAVCPGASHLAFLGLSLHLHSDGVLLSVLTGFAVLKASMGPL